MISFYSFVVAKKRVLVSLVFLYGIFVSLFSASAVTCDASKYDNIGGVCVPKSTTVGNLSEKSVYDIAGNFMGWFIGFMGFVSITGFLVSGFLYFTAAGDEERAKTAKKAFLYSVLGSVVSLGAFVFLNIIDNFLKAGTI